MLILHRGIIITRRKYSSSLEIIVTTQWWLKYTAIMITDLINNDIICLSDVTWQAIQCICTMIDPPIANLE